MKIVKNILSVVVGIIAAAGMIFLVEMLNEKLFPFPAHITINNQEALTSYMKTLPISAYLLILFGYVIGSVIGGVVSTLASGRENARSSLILGTILTAIGLLNPDPIWFKIMSSFIYIPFAFLGFIIGRNKKNANGFS